jgi:hypothetical protein
MPDEATPADDAQDTSAPEQSAAPTDGTPAPESQDSQPESVDWQERYANLQPEYTRATQEAAQYRQIFDLAKQGNEEAIRWLVDQADLELADEDEDDDEDTEPEYHDPRVDQLLAAEQQRQQEAELDQLEGYVDGEIDKLAKSAGVEDLSDTEKDLIFAALAPGDDGNPDVAGAFKKVTGLRDAHIKSYTQQKRRAPLAPSGSSPSHQPDLDDAEQRRQWISDQLAAS